MGFGHLHVHSDYSPLDGAGKIENYIKRAKKLGQSFIAITDHGSTSGLFEAQKYGEKYGVKIILGSEFYLHLDGEEGAGHLILLAKNNNGLKNLFKLQEYAYIKNFYKKPRIDINALSLYHEDLICTSACIANHICKNIMSGDVNKAKRHALNLKEIFKEDFYLEIQPNDIPAQVNVNKTLIRMSNEFSIPLVACNDCHYVLKEDAFAHEVMLALQTKKKMSDPKRFKFDGETFYLRSEEEMREGLNYVDNKNIDLAINNTTLIANLCNARIEKGNYLPKYPIKEGTEDSCLKELVYEKYTSEIIKTGLHTDKYLSDVEYELDVIARNGYSGYFLIVQEYVNWARDNGILVGDGRGSGAGSKVGFITGIHRINPNEHNLLFERFMADGREPDIDVDFSDIDRVFEHLQEVYGEENVARIIAFGTLTAKACTRKVFSTFGHPMHLISKINGLMPKRLEYTLTEALNESEELRKYASMYKTEFSVIAKLEGCISHESQHAGGVIICKNLSSFLPVKSNAEARNKRIVAFDKYMLEELRHFKFDVLGLKTLELLDRILKMIKSTEGEIIDLHSIDYEDEKVYKLLQSGNLSGVFQLSDQAHKVIEQVPNCFADLIAINALIRPGIGDWGEYIARRNGKEFILHPARAPYMADTMGVMTYQEQYLLDCQTFAGWTIAFADKYVRKNKDIKNDLALKERFISDGESNKYSLEILNIIWEEICNTVSGGYGFNKSHSASYAVMSYQTAWLKHYYPKHFYASLMTMESDKENGQQRVGDLIAECKKLSISIIPPNINDSQGEFIASKDGILYRITAITGVGETVINHIKMLRPIEGLSDMLKRGTKRIIKKNVVTNLIKAGCFDFEETDRNKLLTTFTGEALPEYNAIIKNQYEKESLGIYLTSHPCEKYSFQPLSSFTNNNPCLIAGEITDIAEIFDKNGQAMAFITISSHHGNTKCIAFASIWNNKKFSLKDLVIGDIIMIHGKRSGNDVLINKAEILE